MKSPYVSELQPNQAVVSTFLVHSKEIRQKKSGDPYLSLLIGDRTGDVDAKMWDNVAEVMHTFDQDDFVKVKGLLNIYQNRPQLTIHKMQRVDESEVDPSDYFAVSKRDPNEMFAELCEVVAHMTNPHLKALVESILSDEEIARRYRKAPAAKLIHHAYLGGLLEHVLSVCKACYFAAQHYENVDIDLLITGAILHDIGKIYELAYERSFGYTTEGQLLGHITIGLRIIEEKLRALPDFPPRLRILVEHMVLSHHGHLEFGSPKVPLFPEAMLLHYLDDMDSKMECMQSLVTQDPHIDGEWTGYSHSLERTILKKMRFLEGKAEDADTLPAKTAAARPDTIAGPATRGSKEPPQATLFGEKLLNALTKE
jgi:3'-5' exoribonuclease